MTKRTTKNRKWWKRFSGGFGAPATRARKRKNGFNLESLEARNLLAIALGPADLNYLLEQVNIGNDYSQLASPLHPIGVREVSGSNNNLVASTFDADGQFVPGPHADWGQADNDFLRIFATDHPNIDIPSYGVTYAPVKMNQVTDPDGQPVMEPLDFTARMQQAVTPAPGTSPRTITQLITSSDVDPLSPSYNPAAEAAMVQMGGEPVEVSNTVVETGQTAFIPDPGVLGGVPFNDFFVMFGQFFDHGLDFITKGGGFALMPLSPSDPLYDPAPGAQNMMMLSRGALSNPASDFHTDDVGNEVLNDGVVPAFNNNTGLLIDQSQTYGSHPTINVLVRQYDNNGIITGKLITGAEDMLPSDPDYDKASDNLATWADMVANAERLGIELSDLDVLNAPMIRATAVGAIDFNPLSPNEQSNPLNAATWTLYRSSETLGQMSTRTDISVAELATNDPFVRWPNGSVKKTGHAIISDMGNAASPVDQMGNPLQPGEYNEALLASHYVSGDHRVNENAGLTAIHHIFHAEHNIQADAVQVAAVQDAVDGGNLAGLNGWLAGDITQAELDQMVANNTTNTVIDYPAIADALNFDGEKIYQAARIITESEYNHIAIDQYVGGLVVMPEFVSYSSDINMGVSLEFSQAVFRLGHSQNSEKMLVAIPDAHGVKPGEPGYVPTYEPQDLFDAFLKPSFYQEHGPSGIVAGLLNQHANAIDEFVTSALQQTTAGIPLDLGALDIARGRDVGLPTLNEMRQQIFDGLINNTSNSNANGPGIAPYTSWEDFGGHLRHPESLVNFIAAYGRENTIYHLLDMRINYEEGRDSGGRAPGDPGFTQAVTLQDLRANAQQILDDAGNGVPSGTQFLRGGGSPVYNPVTGTWDQNNNGGGDLGFWDVDLWVGGLAEQPLFDAPLGTTFTFIMADFGQRMQDADRFYYLFRMPVGHHLGDQIIGEQFADLIMRTTGLEHIGDAFGFQSATFTLDGTLDGTNTDSTYDGTFDGLKLDGTATSGSDTFGIHDYFNAIYESLPDSVLVVNNSFEVDSLATGAPGVTTNTVFGNYTTTAPTGWTIAQGTGGTWNPTTAAVSGDGHVGAQVAYLQIGASMLDQDTGAPMTEGNTYTLTLNIGNRLDMPGTFGATAKLVAVSPNGTPVAELGTTVVTETDVPTGQWRPVTVTTGPILAAHAGLVLRIEITNSGQSDQVLVDNVHLIETVPGSANDGHIVVAGLEGNDYIVAALGDDYVYGDAGNDVIEGAQGNDHLYGGPGDDWITDYENDDFIHGGDGNDYISAGPGVLDTCHGGNGDDDVHGGDGIDEVFGDNGDDRLYGEGDTDLMEGGDGHDYMEGGDSVDEMFGGNGNDWMRGGVGDDNINGGSGNDLMEGGLGPTANDGDRLNGDTPPAALPVIEFNGDGTQGDMDIASYEDVPIAIVASMQTANANGTSSNLLDTYALVEGLVGSAQNDTLTGADANGAAGNGVNNYLVGGGGNDTLIGLGDDAGETDGQIDFIFGDSVVVDNDLYWIGDPRHAATGHGAVVSTIANWMGTGEDRPVFADGTLGHILGETDASGVDTAVYRGNLADYTITALDANFNVIADPHANWAGVLAVRIVDNRSLTDANGVAVPQDGVDYLVGVENAAFADQTIGLAAYFATPPVIDLDYVPGTMAVASDDFSAPPILNPYGRGSGWAGDWSESGDDNLSSSGQILVSAARLSITGGSPPSSFDGATVSRSVDLSGYQSVQMSFTVSESGLESGQTVQALFDPDGAGAAAPIVLATYHLDTNNAGTQTFALTGPFTSMATLSFAASAMTSAANDIDIDDIAITTQGDTAAGNDYTTTNFSEATHAPVPLTLQPHITDADGTLLKSATVHIRETVAGDQLTLSGALPAGIEATGVGTGTLVLTSAAGSSFADFEAALKLVGFSNTGQNPTNYGANTDRHLDVTVSNGLKDSDVATTTVGITAVNDLPTLGPDTIITNAGTFTLIRIPDQALLANDIDPDTLGLAVTGVANIFNGILAFSHSNNPPAVTVMDMPPAGGSFRYVVGSSSAIITITQQGGTTLNGTAGNEILIGGATNDTINASDGDDFIVWNATGGAGGHDLVDGGTNGVSGDTFVVNGNNTAEIYRVYTRDDWLAVPGNSAASLVANTEIVVTRNGTNAASIIAELYNVEELVINTGGGNDTVIASGNFDQSQLAYNTITVNDNDGGDVVDITRLTSDHRIVLHTDASGQIVGAVRPQDVLDASLLVVPPAFAWRNAALPADVDGSGTATPLDVLLVINWINANSSGPVPSSLPEWTVGTGSFVDVSGDDMVSAIDVLSAINYINSRPGIVVPLAEGESPSVAVFGVIPPGQLSPAVAAPATPSIVPQDPQAASTIFAASDLGLLPLADELANVVASAAARSVGPFESVDTIMGQLVNDPRSLA